VIRHAQRATGHVRPSHHLTATSRLPRLGSNVFKQVDMSSHENNHELVKLEHVKIDGVGRLDSVIYNLDEFEIPLKVAHGRTLEGVSFHSVALLT
jgi:hypothetical protein